MSAVGFHLLPDSATVDSSGQLLVGGCRLTDLATEFGTPLLVYDAGHIRQQSARAKKSFGDRAVYATKAFLCRQLVRLIDEQGLGFDFSTAGELAVLVEAGVDPAKMVFHGNNKSDSELAEALKLGVGRIVVDSPGELDRLDRLVGEGLAAPKIWLRLTPGVEVHAHEYVASGADDNKFGLPISTGQAAEVITQAQSLKTVDLIGFHSHIGSQVFDLKAYQRAAEVVIDFVKPYGLSELSLGGGLGVAYTNDETSPTFSAWAQALEQAARQSGFDHPIGVEPGRSLVATAGISLYEIGTIKELAGIRTYVSVDGGMSDNIRPALYGSRYEAFLPARVQADRSRPVRVVGKHCEPGDFLVADGHLPPEAAVGDILAIPVSGAYGYSMASNYNRQPKPAVVFVDEGQARLVLRRASLAELSGLEVDDLVV